MLHCNGRCQMMKKLKQEENKDKQNPDRKNKNKDEVISSKSFFSSVQQENAITFSDYNIFKSKSAQDIAADFFHPPAA